MQRVEETKKTREIGELYAETKYCMWAAILSHLPDPGKASASKSRRLLVKLGEGEPV
jgi:hypothetical protein